MKSRLKLFVFVLFTGLLVQGTSTRAATDEAKPMAVLFYADWCTSCKLLEPKYAPARSGLEDKIQFVKLDVTNADTKAKASATAGALGIGPLYYSNHATGWVALLDSKHNKVGELHSDESIEDMRAALSKLAQGS